MIDIHTHILPAVDDGSKSDAESLLMLEAAVQDGIHTLVATPHYNGRYASEKVTILEEVARLNQMIKENNLRIEVLPGQEIRIYGDLLLDYEAGKLLTVAGCSSYMLIELPFEHVPHYAQRLLYDLELAGIKPIIAHPERNKEFLKHPEKLYQFVKKGALTQLTAASLLGCFGGDVQKFSKQLIEANLIHTIATDAHNMSNRAFNMSEAYELIIKKYGHNYASYLQENAQLIITDKPIYGEAPSPIGKKKLFGFL